MGTCNAQAALEYVLKEYHPRVIVSMGFGGALHEEVRAGDLIWPSKVYLLGARVEGALELPDVGELSGKLSGRIAMKRGSAVTLRRPMAKSDIRRIISPLALTVCDMETFPLAELSVRQGLPFFAFRSITDTADEDIPHELFGVSDRAGEYKVSRSVRLLLSRPNLIPSAVRLGRTSRRASRNLCTAVRALIDVL